jgi:hypothetical protein
LCTEPARKPLQATSKQEAAAVSKKSAKVGKKAAPDKKPASGSGVSDMENAEEGKSETVAAADVQGQADDAGKGTGSGDAAVEGKHPEYGTPPHPDAEVIMIGSKAVWQYINDKGEEVTVVRCCVICETSCTLWFSVSACS